MISLPSGVFKPYASVSAAILLFTKGGRTDNVFFYSVAADGRSLDDKREVVDQNDLPDCLARWYSRDPLRDTDRTAKAFFVPATEIRNADYDLSLSRYRTTIYETERHDPPKQILDRLRVLNSAIAADISELEGLLR